jgi:serine/threonine protein kinase
MLGVVSRPGYAAPIIVGPANAEVYAKSSIGKLVAERFRLVSLLGLGGMSAVYRATDPDHKSFALKVLYPDLLDSEAEQRFARESKLLIGLSHPHIVPILAAGRDEALGQYLVMPVLAGRDLDGVLEEHGALAPESAVRVALQAARGLSAAHRVGIVHRDVKPGNLLLDRDGAEILIKVCDFGVGKRLGFTAEVSLTSTGSPLGTPDYAAPEQLQNAKSADERADIWGLAATLYQMLCGVAPFSHIESVADLLLAICSDDVPHIQDRAPWIDSGLARAVHRALNRDPNLRPSSMDDFADRLRRFSGGDELLDESRITRVSSVMRQRVEGRADLALSVVTAPARVGASDADPLGLVGKRLSDRYRVIRLIGKGGMGSVYEVEGPGALKLAAKVVSAGMANASPIALERFAREARTASDINSPNVARTIDAGSDEALGMPYIIMELLHGVELSAVLKKEGALDPQIAVRLVLQGASGVAAAHASGVVHRDIKPANLFLQIDDATQEVTVKVCDFGVAKRTRVSDGNNLVSQLSLTRTGGMLGSPMYMSPEQAKDAKTVDERTDVWSLSVVLWEALSGRRLWGGQTSLGELIVAICTEPIPQLDIVAPWIPRDLARVVHRGLERDPNLRPSSVRAFIESLSLFSGGTDRVQQSQLVAMTVAERGALELKVNISASAAAGLANLARGGRGGVSLPPERETKRRSGRPESSSDNWLLVGVLMVLVGGLSVLLGYLMRKN